MAARSVNEAFSSVDAAWLHMEEPTSMAMITGVMTFNQPIDYRRLKATVENRMLTFRRFRMRVRESALGLGMPRWELDPNFNLNAHLHRIALPEPGDQETLQDLVGDLMSTPLDFSKPLWQIHLVENYNAGCALVIRLHHCIADGLALMQVFLSMSDDDPHAPWPTPPALDRSETSALDRLLKPAVKAYRRVSHGLQAAENLLQGGMQNLIHPTKILDLARLGADAALALGKVVLIGPDQKTIFKGKCGVAKRAAWSQPIQLQDVKAIGRSMGGTINDILLSAVTGALRRYLESRDEPTEGVNIRALVPVSIRPQDDFDQLGNQFGLVFLSLPIGIRDPLRRLRVLKHRMDAIKNSPEAVVTFSILGAMGMTPIQIQRIIVDIFAVKATAVMTNVPGPRQPKYFAGRRIHDFMFWVPSPGELGMGVSIFSFAGEVVLGIATDACLVPNPQQIITDFQAEIEDLMRWKQVEPDLAQLGEADNPAADGSAESRLAVDELAEEVEALDLSLEIEQAGLGSPGFDLPARSFEVLNAANGACQAITKTGHRCRNRALPGVHTCRVHTPRLEY